MTSMMQRYRQVKDECPGMLLLFRMGDFYEAFNDDAEVLAAVLGLMTSTRRRDGERIGYGADTCIMAGFPYHQLEGYLKKLIREGHRVAICDQVDDPASVPKQQIHRHVTPGRLF